MVVEHGPRFDVSNDIEVAETHMERVQEEQKNVRMVCSVQFKSWRLTGQYGHSRPYLVGHSEIMLGHLVDAYTCTVQVYTCRNRRCALCGLHPLHHCGLLLGKCMCSF